MTTARFRILALLAIAAGLIWSCNKKSPGDPGTPPPPAAPVLSLTHITTTSIDLHWQFNAVNGNDATGFRISSRPDTSQVWTLISTQAHGTAQTTISGLPASSTFHFHMTAYNQNGESALSNEVSGRTLDGPGLPNPPTGVTAAALTYHSVRVTWTDTGTQDSFLVDRKDSSGVWTRIAETPDNIELFLDATVHASADYDYRVGSKNSIGISWCADSAHVRMPDPGAPAAPESLSVRVVVGTDVILAWFDRSDGEATRFDIGRAPAGQLPTVIDTVPGNVTTFTDSLGDRPGFYYYQVRSANQYGVSAWTSPIEADYRYCSNGIVPICRGNYWVYSVDSAGTQFSRRRSVAGIFFPPPFALDWYYITEDPMRGNEADTLYCLRNDAGQGCRYLPYPLVGSANGDTLFRYPAGHTGDWYRFNSGAGQDCVLVLSTSSTRVINGRTFTGVVSYERFVDAYHRFIYYLEPNTVGLISEEAWTGSVLNPQLVSRRNLTSDYLVQNGTP